MLPAVVALTLAACGGGATTKSAPTEPPPSRSSTPTTAVSPSTTGGTTSATGGTTSPTAATEAMPGAPKCGGPTSAPTQIRPKILVLACADYNASMKDISWTSWGSVTAIGVGTFTENQCVPNCAQGTFASYPNSQVELEMPAAPGGTLIFEKVVVTPSGGAPTYTNPSPGAWGWST